MADEIVTGRLERNGQKLASSVKASIRAGKGISFLFPPNQIHVGDTLRLLVPTNRVIDFTVVLINPALGQAEDSVDGRITRDDLYSPA